MAPAIDPLAVDGNTGSVGPVEELLGEFMERLQTLAECERARTPARAHSHRTAVLHARRLSARALTSTPPSRPRIGSVTRGSEVVHSCTDGHRIEATGASEPPMIRQSRLPFVPLVIAGLIAGCATARNSSITGEGTHDWSAVSCAECAASRVAVDLRRSIGESAGQGSHLVARVRNLTSDSIVFVLTLRADMLPDADGYVPSEEWKVLLGPAGAADAATTIVLRRKDVSLASISRLERLATSRATASKP